VRGGEVTPPPPYAALGDSYSAGVGAGKYDSSSGRCYRSENAYPHKIPESYDVSLFFYACNGATTEDVLDSQINQPEVNNAKLLTITVGGNDIGFASILKHCIKNVDCKNKPMQGQTTPIGNALPDAIADLKSTLIDTYNALSNKAQSAQIYVLGYPHLFPSQHDSYCIGDRNIDPTEQDFLNEMSDDLNSKIEEAAKEAAKTANVTFVPVTDKFSGHEICTEQPWINNLNLFTRIGYLPSFHPNAAGNKAYADTLKAAIGDSLTIVATKSL